MDAPGTVGTSTYPRLRLNTGRDYPLLQGHPWLFSRAFQSLPPAIAPGDVVDVLSSDGAFVARGHVNPANSLAFRVLTRDPDEQIDAAFYRRRVAAALALRRLLPADVTGYRLINAEADYLPGVVVDRYDRFLVAQISTAGAERARPLLLAALEEVTGAAGILARDDIRVRAREGLAVGGTSLLVGTVPPLVEIGEGPVRYLVDTHGGQKTGFFFDQREKRARVSELAPHLTTTLNAFSYTGGFGLAALARNPKIRTVNVDLSAPALDLAKRNYALNGHDPAAHEFVQMDVANYLNSASDRGLRFDLIVLDPPAYAKALSAKERALRGYESLNLQGARLVAPGGLLLTCSCSGAVDYAEFEQAVRQGLLRAGRAGQLLAVFGPSLDHPTLPGFLEDRYLKALLFRLE